MEIDPQEIRKILNNDDFNRLIDAMRAGWTKKAMAVSTDAEQREAYVAEYHALERVLSTMRSVANTPGDTDDDGEPFA